MGVDRPFVPPAALMAATVAAMSFQGTPGSAVRAADTMRFSTRGMAVGGRLPKKLLYFLVEPGDLHFLEVIGRHNGNP